MNSFFSCAKKVKSNQEEKIENEEEEEEKIDEELGENNKDFMKDYTFKNFSVSNRSSNAIGEEVALKLYSIKEEEEKKKDRKLDSKALESMDFRSCNFKNSLTKTDTSSQNTANPFKKILKTMKSDENKPRTKSNILTACKTKFEIPRKKLNLRSKSVGAFRYNFNKYFGDELEGLPNEYDNFIFEISIVELPLRFVEQDLEESYINRFSNIIINRIYICTIIWILIATFLWINIVDVYENNQIIFMHIIYFTCYFFSFLLFFLTFFRIHFFIRKIECYTLLIILAMIIIMEIFNMFGVYNYFFFLNDANPKHFYNRHQFLIIAHLDALPFYYLTFIITIDFLLPIRVSKTFWLHVIFSALNLISFFFFGLTLKLWRWCLSRLLIINLSLLLGISFRWIFERRLRFFFFVNQEKIGESKKSREIYLPASSTTTSMEELLTLINLAGIKLRRVRRFMLPNKTKMVLESESLLLKCIRILTESNDLFAFKNGEQQNKEAKDILGYYAPKTLYNDSIDSNIKMRSSLNRNYNEKVSDVPVISHFNTLIEYNVDKMFDQKEQCFENRSIYVSSPYDLWYLFNTNDEELMDQEKDEKCQNSNYNKKNISLTMFLKYPPPCSIIKRWSDKLSFDWNIDMIKLSIKSDNILICVGYDLLAKKIRNFNFCNVVTLNRFLFCIQSFYQPNTYHNQLHAAQVAHCSFFLARMILNINTMSALDLGLFVLACLCHDIGHKGKNNSFYNNKQDLLSIIYNDVSVLENFHCSLTFRILSMKDCNIFSSLPSSEFMLVRSRIIDLILSTDMAYHFENMSKFRIRKNAIDFNSISNDEDMCMVLRMCIKAGDLSHAAFEWRSHVEWSYRVVAEFYAQGDQELLIYAHRNSVKIQHVEKMIVKSPLCDRNKHYSDYVKSQISFIKLVVQPLFEELTTVDKSGRVKKNCMKNIELNLLEWTNLLENPEEFYKFNMEQQNKISVLEDFLNIQKESFFKVHKNSFIDSGSYLTLKDTYK